MLFYQAVGMVKNIFRTFHIDLTTEDVIDIANINLYDKADFIFK